MPDEDKTTNTNQPITGDTSFPVSSPTTTPLDISGQMNDAPPPPPMEDGAFSPPPPIVEETKPEEVSAPSQTSETNGNTQEIPDIPPVITTSGTGGKKPVGKKMIATILGVLVLVGGLGAGVILVQNQQDIREKAYIPEEVVVPPQCVKEGNDCDSIKRCCSGLVCTSSGICLKSDPQDINICRKDCVSDRSNCVGGSQVGSKGYGCGINEYCCDKIPPIRDQDVCRKDCVSLPAQCISGTQVGNAGYGQCEDREYCCDQVDCYAISPRMNSGDYGFCNWPVNNEKINGKSFCYSGATCPQSSPSCTGDAVVGAGVIGGAQYCEGGGSPSIPNPTTKPTLPPGITCSCLPIKAYDDEWVAITNLSSLVAGDVVRFTVEGKTNSGAIDIARFTINGTLRPEVTTRKPITNEFYDEYTIPEDTTSFTINAEIHHTTIGWF